MWASGKWVRLKKFICGCGSLNKVLVQYFFAMEERFSSCSVFFHISTNWGLGGGEEEGERDKITTVEPLRIWLLEIWITCSFLCWWWCLWLVALKRGRRGDKINSWVTLEPIVRNLNSMWFSVLLVVVYCVVFEIQDFGIFEIWEILGEEILRRLPPKEQMIWRRKIVKYPFNVRK